ncbi:MAG: alpha/beta hydrolase, partial [Deltaproteobacteria bacterium]
DLPNAVLAVIPECGHIPEEGKPEKTAAVIKDFVMGKIID